MDDTGAALARVAADMSTGEAQLLAQQLHQKRSALDGRRNRLAVYGKAHRLLHRYLPGMLASSVATTAKTGRNFMPARFAVKPLTGHSSPGEVIEYPADDRRKSGDPQYRWKPDVLRLDRRFGRCNLRPGNRSPRRGFGRLGRLLGGDRGDEPGEEVFRHLTGDRVDQARADLRQLAADMGLHGIVQPRSAAVLGEVDLGAALGKAGDAAAPLARDRVALRRVEIRQRHLAREIGLHRADLRKDLGGEFGVRDLFDRLTTGNTFL